MRTVIVTAIGSFSADIVIKKCRENGNWVIGCDVYPREMDCGRGERGGRFIRFPMQRIRTHYIGP